MNKSLDLDAVLQEILDSACSLTDAHYGVTITLDDAGQVEEFLASGVTPARSRRGERMPAFGWWMTTRRP